MNDRATMPSALPNFMSQAQFRAAHKAAALCEVSDAAFRNIHDDAHVSDILNDIRDGSWKHVEFDGQLTRLMREFPAVASLVGKLPGNTTQAEHVALVAVLQACARIERLLFNQAHADEIAAREAEL